MSPLPSPVVLYYIHAPGCHACAETKPIVDSFKSRWGNRVPVKSVDITEATVGPFALGPGGKRQWSPDKTPTIMLQVGTRAFVVEGSVNSMELEAWVASRLERVMRGER